MDIKDRVAIEEALWYYYLKDGLTAEQYTRAVNALERSVDLEWQYDGLDK